MTEHPCDGLWLRTDALTELTPDQREGAVDALDRGGYVGLIGEATSPVFGGDTRDLARWVELPAPLCRPDSEAWARAMRLEPDLIGLPFPGASAAGELDAHLAELAGHEIGATLLVAGGAPAAEALSDMLARQHGIMAIALERLDEELVDVVRGRDDDVAVILSGDEAVSGFRRGATGFDGLPALLGPAMGGALLALCSDDMPHALDLERRLLRFLEGPFAREVRAAGVPRTGALMALGGWLPRAAIQQLGIGDPGRFDGLRGALLAACPELTGD